MNSFNAIHCQAIRPYIFMEPFHSGFAASRARGPALRSTLGYCGVYIDEN